MPRVKCTFCDTLVTAKPKHINQEGFFPKCMVCSKAPPPEEWRCQASSISPCRLGGTRKKGDRCKNWISRKHHKLCAVHRKLRDKNEKA